MRLLERICRESGSASVRHDAAYLRTAVWQSRAHPDWIWCEVLNECAFYMARRRAGGGLRLIEMAVVEAAHGQGLGRAMCGRLFARAQNAGITVIQFRTNRDNSALGFWQKMGGRIMDVNGDDYEMEITLRRQ